MSYPYIDPEDTIKGINLKEKAGFLTGGLNLENPPEGIPDSDSPDMFNVEFTRQGSIRPRGFPNRKFEFLDKPNFEIKNSFEFRDNNNVNWLVITDNENVYISDDLSDWVAIPISFLVATVPQDKFNSSYTTRFAFLNNKLFGTNGIDPVWTYNMDTNAFAALDIENGHTENVPKGRYIAAHNSRIFLQNTTADQTALYHSRLDDETLFTHPISGILNLYRIESGSGGFGIGIKTLREDLVVFSNSAIDAFRGYGENEFRVEPITREQEKACVNANTIQEHNGGLIYLGKNGIFYKLTQGGIAPIGSKLSEGLHNKVMQVYTYQEELIRLEGDGTNKWDEGNVDGTPVDITTPFFVPDGANVNNELDFTTGSLFTNQFGAGLVPNGFFTNDWERWTYNNTWSGNESDYGDLPAWVISSDNGSKQAKLNTLHRRGVQYDYWYYTRCSNVSMSIVDAHDDTVLGFFTKTGTSGTWYIDDLGYTIQTGIMPRGSATMSSGTPASYTSFSSTIAADVAEFMTKIKYRKVKLRVSFTRKVLKHPRGGTIDTWYMGGRSSVETEPFYADGSQFAFNYVIGGADSVTDNCYVDNVYGAMTFNRVVTENYYTKQISCNVAKWGAFDIDYTNPQEASLAFAFRVHDGLVWGPWTAITPGDTIDYLGIPTGNVMIEFRVQNYGNGAGDYQEYSPNEFKFLSFYFYKRTSNLPDIDSDICSVVYDERYFVCMGVHDMGNFFGHNNIMFIYDEWAGGPRWARCDTWADTMQVYAGRLLFMNTNRGFTSDSPQNVGVDTGAIINLIDYDNGMGSYYKTKAFDFNTPPEILKWFKFITFDFKKADRTLPLYWHIQTYLDGKYAGSILNYTFNAIGQQTPIDDGRQHMSRFAKSLKFSTLFGSRTPQYWFSIDPVNVREYVLGYGTTLQLEYIFYTLGDPITKLLNYEVLNTMVYLEEKDYAVLPVDKSGTRMRSNEP